MCHHETPLPFWKGYLLTESFYWDHCTSLLSLVNFWTVLRGNLYLSSDEESRTTSVVRK